MRIILPLPPTDNRLRVSARYSGRLVNTSQYRSWLSKSEELWFWKYSHCITPLQADFAHQVKIPYQLFLKDKRSDISNYEKATKDFLTKRLYDDDKWVSLDLQLPVEIDKLNPRLEIII